MPLLRTAGNARRVGTHEERRYDLPVHAETRDIDREVMAFKAPAPRMCITRIDEERQIIQFRIAARPPGKSFKFAQYAFQLDDATRERGATRAQPGSEQPERCFTLLRIHVAERETSPA